MGIESGRVPGEIRHGDVIRRSGVERRESIPVSAIEQYILKYGDPRKDFRPEDTGRVFEDSILGTPDIEMINAIAIEDGLISQKQGRDGMFYSIRKRGVDTDPQALERYFKLVKEHQSTLKSGSILAKLKDSLENLGDKKTHVEYYSSVGTALDHTPGINADAFLEINGSVITLDVTMQDQKMGMGGADVIITADDLSMYDIDLPSDAIQGNRKDELVRKAREEQITILAERIFTFYKEHYEQEM